MIHRVDGKVSTELAPYRDRLDHLVASFGEDRILFGSDWPNSDGVAPIDKIVGVVREYFEIRCLTLPHQFSDSPTL